MPDAWAPGPVHPSLAPGEVHVWRASLAVCPAELERLGGVISDEERARAARFRFDVHRARFVAGRGIQRHVLARYLAVPPDSIRYDFSAHGKPSLAGEAAASGLRFNVSNSDDGLLIALTLRREIGVDLEPVRPSRDRDAVARRFFSGPENEVYGALADDERDAAFFACWTRKEAYIKAVGEGLSMPLHSFDVTLRPGEPARLLATRGAEDRATRWTLRELEVGDGWAAALAVEGPLGALRLYDWDPARPPVAPAEPPPERG
jgi:4'-phosphopantetheinyl transferase